MVSKRYIQRMKLKRGERIEVEDLTGNLEMSYFDEIDQITYDRRADKLTPSLITLSRWGSSESQTIPSSNYSSRTYPLDEIKKIQRLEIAVK